MPEATSEEKSIPDTLPLIPESFWENNTESGIANSHLTQKSSKYRNRKYPLTIKDYEALTDSVLHHLYPKSCPVCDTVLTKRIRNRVAAIACAGCHFQGSRFAYTPLHRFRLPTYMFGYALYESVMRYPQVLTATELQTRLGIAKNSATLLKRRLQLFTADQMPKIKTLIHRELAERFTNFEFPRADVDLKESINGHAIPQADVCILYSSKPTANKGRKRTKYRGTSSV